MTDAALDPDSLEGLRGRKKQQTRREISDAAYAVVRDHGIEALTADAVAQRANVSRRTFFNYFPTVDSALEPIVEEFLADIEVKLGEIEMDAQVMGSLARAVRDNEDEDLLERITVLGAATLMSAGHRGLLHECSQAWLDGFADRLRARIGDDVDELFVVGAATALVSAAEASLRVWLQRTDGRITPATLALRQRLLGEAIARLGAGFDPPAETPTVQTATNQTEES